MPAPQDAPAVSNSLWRPGSRTFLRDQRASSVGDVITVLVSIQDEAQLQNRTQRARQGNDKLGIPQIFGMQTRWLPRGASPDSLRDTLGTTIVVVTHELASIFAIGNNSVFLDADSKTMIAQGHPKQLLEECPHPTVRQFLTRGSGAGGKP